MATYSAAIDAELLDADREGRVFWQMRLRILRTLLRQVLRQARLQLAITVALTSLLWVGLYFLFVDGFVFLARTIPADLHGKTIELVFGFFFATMMVMLAFSAAIIIYSSLFRSEDVAFLLTMPVRTARVFLHKFQEAVFLSSWAFLMLGSPMLLAYGTVHDVPWHYYVLLVPFMMFFAYIPAAIGAIACLLIVYRMPNARTPLLVAGVVAFLVGLVWVGWSLRISFATDLLAGAWFQDVLSRLQFTQHRLLPSWWLMAGLLQSAHGQLSESVLFFCLVVANALFFRQVAIAVAAGVLRPAYSKLHGRGGRPKRAKLGLLDRVTLLVSRPLPGQMRWLLVKDFRLFRRDPVQWSQFLIFFGLLLLYFINIHRFTYDVYYIGWINMVSLLNLAVVALLLSTFTTRFIFPMVSLEGRRFWILGLLPMRRGMILWSKFLFAAGGSLIPCCVLIAVSDLMLGVEPVIVVSHQFVCLNLCIGLAGIAVGLGAKMPNLREQSPARIAAGFGGTVNLVLSTAYIVAILLLAALPFHLWVAAHSHTINNLLTYRPTLGTWLDVWRVGGVLAAAALTALVTGIPLRMGFRAFRALEF